MDWEEADLGRRRKGDVGKVRIARRLRRESQQTVDRKTIVDGVGEQYDVLPGAGQETMMTVNCPA